MTTTTGITKEHLLSLLEKVRGCSFASVSSVTSPKPGIHKVTTGMRCILFSNSTVSGYERMVKRRLLQAGKNPDNFVLGDLPWGQRVEGTPLIEHNGKLYLQLVQLSAGESRYYIGNSEVNPDELGLKERRTNQGLPGDEVLVCTFKLESLTEITLMKETLSLK